MNPLWDFSVRIYSVPEVKDLLLKLQDRYHIDVNTALWCLWADASGYQFSEADVAEILSTTRDLADHTTRPLRAVRLFLSAPKPGISAAEQKRLRDMVLQVELMSEELILRRLDEVTRATAQPLEDKAVFGIQSRRSFSFARSGVDTPIMIDDEGDPLSPSNVFDRLITAVKDHV